jgi:hypothetical protein
VCPPLSGTEMSSIVETGGGRYIGFLKEVPGKMEPIVLFISPQTRTTLGIPISPLTVEPYANNWPSRMPSSAKQVRSDKCNQRRHSRTHLGQ